MDPTAAPSPRVAAGQIVVVMGMHRSGTSALAGALHASGISMGSTRVWEPEPRPENPEGFFEDRRFRIRNDALLRRYGYVVDDWLLPAPTARLHRRRDGLAIRALLRRRDLTARGPWGWKDPRQMLTHGAWLDCLAQEDMLDRVRAVLIVRDPAVVATSMMARDNTDDPIHATRLWEAYHRAVLEVLQTDPHPWLVVDYDELVHRSGHHGVVESFLGLPDGALQAGGFTPRLARSRPADAALPPGVVQMQQRLAALMGEPRA